MCEPRSEEEGDSWESLGEVETEKVRVVEVCRAIVDRASADEFASTTTVGLLEDIVGGGNPENSTRSVCCHLTSSGCAHMVIFPVTAVEPPSTACTLVVLPNASVNRQAVEITTLSMPLDVVNV